MWVRGIDQSHDDAIPVTHDTRRGITSYYWTDDPRWLLYLQDTDGNEEWHLYRVDLDDPDAPAVDLTQLGPGSRVFAVDPETTVPGTVIAWMNPRPLYVDVFRIDLATGERTPLVERTDPTEFFLLDRTGRPAWYLSKDTDGTHRDLRRRPRHRREASAPPPRRPGAPAGGVRAPAPRRQRRAAR